MQKAVQIWVQSSVQMVVRNSVQSFMQNVSDAETFAEMVAETVQIMPLTGCVEKMAAVQNIVQKVVQMFMQ